MTDPGPRYCLRPTQSDQDWRAYHSIRRDAIFAVFMPDEVYDENHPDETKCGNLPHVLECDGVVIGTVRIDIIDDERVGFRLVGIRNDLQRQGHGKVLLHLAEQVARNLGKREVVLNANSRSLAFYLANGYGQGEWKDVGPVPAGLIRVGRQL